MKPRNLLRMSVFLLPAVALLNGPAEASCGTAYCLLNTNWNAQGVWTDAGVRLDVHYENIDQDQLRSGAHKANAADAGEDHTELETHNQNVVSTLDYRFNSRWAMSFNAPYTIRDHEHVHHADDGDDEHESWHYRELGDVRINVQHSLLSSDDQARSFGAELGLKLATGTHKVDNGEERAERSLQPGTGTTDVLFGLWFRQALPQWNSLFSMHWHGQTALAAADHYRPGNAYGWDSVYRYNMTHQLGLIMQLNAQLKERDNGAQAEPLESGGKRVMLSPGVSYDLSHSSQVYAYWQKPIYQDVNGTQLTARQAVAAGISWRF